MASPLRLAVSLNGAVALGAYEAGAVTQLYTDLYNLNQGSPSPLVVLDTISGASAGSISGLLLAQALATGQHPSDFHTRMWGCWIDQLNLVSLFGDTSNPSNSLFDPAHISAIAAEIAMTDDELREGWHQAQGHPVAFFVSVTNLDGMPYEIPLANGQCVVPRLYADTLPVLFQHGVSRRADKIDEREIPMAELVQSVIASSAFPIAFPTQELECHIEDYPTSEALLGDLTSPLRFTMTDGGILNNEPVGRAISATRFLRDHLGLGDTAWSYVIVEPDPATPEATCKSITDRESKHYDHGLDLGQLLGAITNTYFKDAMFRDLTEIDHTNRLIRKLDAATAKLSAEQRAAIFEAAELADKSPIEVERVPRIGNQPLAGAFFGHFGGFFERSYREHDYYIGCLEMRAWLNDWLSRNHLPVITGDLATQSVSVGTGGFAGIHPSERKMQADAISNRLITLIERYIPITKSGCLGLPIVGPIVAPIVRSQIRSAVLKHLSG